MNIRHWLQRLARRTHEHLAAPAGSGWIRVCPYDSVGRRALWVRWRPGQLEFCAGREGRDWRGALRLDGNTSHRDLCAVRECLDSAAWSVRT